MTEPRNCPCTDKPHLTEDDVRRIVSEVSLKAMELTFSRRSGYYNTAPQAERLRD